LELPFDAASLPAGRELGEVVIMTAENATSPWKALPTTVEGGFAKASVSHLSLFVVAIPTASYTYSVDIEIDADALDWKDGAAAVRLRVRDLLKAFGGQHKGGEWDPYGKIFGGGSFPDWDTMKVEEIVDNGSAAAKVELQREAGNRFDNGRQTRIEEIPARRGENYWPAELDKAIDVTQDSYKATSLTDPAHGLLTFSEKASSMKQTQNRVTHYVKKNAAVYKGDDIESAPFTMELGDATFEVNRNSCVYVHKVIKVQANTKYSLNVDNVVAVGITSDDTPTAKEISDALAEALNTKSGGEINAISQLSTATDPNSGQVRIYVNADRFVHGVTVDKSLLKDISHSYCTKYAACRKKHKVGFDVVAHIERTTQNDEFDDEEGPIPYFFQVHAKVEIAPGKIGGGNLLLRRAGWNCSPKATNDFGWALGRIGATEKAHQSVFWVNAPRGCERTAELWFSIGTNSKGTIRNTRMHRFEPYLVLSQPPSGKTGRYRISFNAADANNGFLQLPVHDSDTATDLTSKIGSSVAYENARWQSGESYQLDLKSQGLDAKFQLAQVNARITVEAEMVLPSTTRPRASVEMAGYESEPLHLLLKPTEDTILKSVDVTTPFTNAAGNTLNLDLKKYILAREDDFKPDHFGVVPSYLPLSANPDHTLPAEKNSLVNLLFRTPPLAQASICAGTYRGTVSLTLNTSDGDNVVQVPIELHLLEMVLPKAPGLEVITQTSRFWFNELSEFHGFKDGKRDVAFTKMLFDAYATHRFSGLDQGPGALYPVSGNPKIKFTPMCLLVDDKTQSDFQTGATYGGVVWGSSNSPLFAEHMGPVQTLDKWGQWQDTGEGGGGHFYAHTTLHASNAFMDLPPAGQPSCWQKKTDASGQLYVPYIMPYNEDHELWQAGQRAFYKDAAETINSWGFFKAPYRPYIYMDEHKELEADCRDMAYEQTTLRMVETFALAAEEGWRPLPTIYPWQYKYLRNSGTKLSPGGELRFPESYRWIAEDIATCRNNPKACIFDLSQFDKTLSHDEKVDRIRFTGAGLHSPTAGLLAWLENLAGATWNAGLTGHGPTEFSPPCGGKNCSGPVYEYAPTTRFEQRRDAFEDYDYIKAVKAREKLGLKLPNGKLKEVIAEGQLSKGNWQFFRPLYLAKGKRGSFSVEGDLTLYIRNGSPPRSDAFDCKVSVSDENDGLKTCKLSPGFVYVALHAAERGSAFKATIDLELDSPLQNVLAEIAAMRYSDDVASNSFVAQRTITYDMSKIQRVRRRLGKTFEAFWASDAGMACTVAMDALENGAVCTANKQCQSGFCVDGLCCDKACDGQCETCKKAEGADDDGSCGGLLEEKTCDDESECTTDDVCKLGKCEGETKDEASVCANGACFEGVCEPLLASGETCSLNGFCGTGFCVDETCCEKAACDPCQTCGGGTCEADSYQEGDSCNSDSGTCQEGICVDNPSPDATVDTMPNPTVDSGVDGSFDTVPPSDASVDTVPPVDSSFDAGLPPDSSVDTMPNPDTSVDTTALKANGESCVAAGECEGSLCSDDGYCCSSACLGECSTCATGVCATRPQGSLCNGGQGACDPFGTCLSPDAGTPAADATVDSTVDMGVPSADSTVDTVVQPKANGQSCGSGGECNSGNCFDGVCCNTACGVSFDSNDCQACSVAAGAAQDGVCGYPSGASCESAFGQCYSGGTCQGVGFCSGSSPSPNGTICNLSDSCSSNDICNSGTCEPGFTQPDGTACSSQTVGSGTCAAGVCQ
jgi:hypothetical protein